MWQISLISLLLLSGANAAPNCSECSPVNNCCSLCTNLTCEDIPSSISGFDNCRWIEDLDIRHGRCRNINDSELVINSNDGSGNEIDDNTLSGDDSGSGVNTTTIIPGSESSANRVFKYDWFAIPFAAVAFVI